jgi:hypothetical protein
VAFVGARYPEVRRLGRLKDVVAPADAAEPATSTTPLQSMK